ncbi:related to dienelactone hydrolase and related enzymes [Armillaria ostoyae]|uniref:Related to dienelactone hydrolase and related enzymes n=1 Tax=Armillaria ostoyae TaxID=47428 RepID=A0A284R3B4_ARMOS|nr:related to dienelactone hydrolase and related enzymes [Armillaria ostoyae]
MAKPASYDPDSPNEKYVPLPSAPLVTLSENAVLQPPLTRRGTGPGMIIFLPPASAFETSTEGDKTLDPEPVQKWAEEGFAIVGVTPSASGWSVEESLAKGVDALLDLKELDIKDKFAVTVFYPNILCTVLDAISRDPRISCVVSFGAAAAVTSTVPIAFHVPTSYEAPETNASTSVYKYKTPSPYFILPQAEDYKPTFASIAHTRNVVFLRKHIGGPHFDIEAIWDEHTYFEFEVRSVSQTMGTMVQEPYVNHVTTMTGGIGRQNLTAFYRDHFIFANPADTELETVSRTVGPDRIVEEFIFKCTHDKTIDWLLPAVPPTGKRLEIPMLGVVNVRGDRLYHEHIWWDQGTALLQSGLIPTHVPFPLEDGKQMLRLPVAGQECVRLLVNERDGTSNEMFEWGIRE